MSVLACDRRGCENIMCDRYSEDYGYICDGCFRELCASGIETDIEKFMDMDKQGQRNSFLSHAQYDSIFQLREED